MNCEEAQPLFSAYLDRELTAAQNGELAVHAIGCAVCQKELNGLLRMKFLVARLPSRQMPADLRQSIQDATAAAPIPPPPTPSFPWWWIPCLALGGLALWIFSQRYQPIPANLPMAQRPAEVDQTAKLKPEAVARFVGNENERRNRWN